MDLIVLSFFFTIEINVKNSTKNSRNIEFHRQINVS